MVSGEEQQSMLRHRPHFEHWPEGDVGESLGMPRVDHISISTRDGAELLLGWAAPDAARRRRICKAQSKGGKKSARLRRSGSHLQRAPLHLFRLTRINVVARGQNEWPLPQDLRLPGMRKRKIDVHDYGSKFRIHCSCMAVSGTGNPARPLDDPQRLCSVPAKCDHHRSEQHRRPADAAAAMRANPMARAHKIAQIRSPARENSPGRQAFRDP